MGNGSQESRNNPQSRRSSSNSERLESPSEQELSELRDLAQREMDYDLSHRGDKQSSDTSRRSHDRR
ncbi:MAG: hypothetical protein DI536_24175 [Archangium gephyra]|uniref:Uncharacterized protein n=1 Tax=Archangium gephyra TaxID=48 RepID=A0A2W5T8B1_9BACT|nr:MAG: hypothetical protein DI536_24175 [Archangium gephyra]